MTPEQIKKKLEETRCQWGDWTAHNIHLGEDIYTIGPSVIGNEVKVQRALQLVADTLRRPFSELRVLDLACLEGLYAIEFARQGACAMGIEGREANLSRAVAVKEILGLEHLELLLDDVRNLSVEKHGTFDVVLCLGIFYHLDAPDIFHFAKAIADCCSGMAIFDTVICLKDEEPREYEGRAYWGGIHIEHDSRSSEEDRKRWVWASLDNPKSFWLTHSSLCNLLRDVGFSSVLQPFLPAVVKEYADRLALVALKGDYCPVISNPLLDEKSLESLPEEKIHVLSPRVRSEKDLYPEKSLFKRIRRRLFGQSW